MTTLRIGVALLAAVDHAPDAKHLSPGVGEVGCDGSGPASLPMELCSQTDDAPRVIAKRAEPLLAFRIRMQQQTAPGSRI